MTVPNVAQLLQQIADNTGHRDEAWVAAISGGAAVLAAAVSALFSYAITARTVRSQERVEERRLRAEIVTAERLRWLQDLRQRVAHLYTQMDMQYSHLKRPEATQEALDQLSFDVLEESHALTLMLNELKDNDQLQARAAIEEAKEFLMHCFGLRAKGAIHFDDSRYTKLKSAVFDAVGRIGHETWEQIKRME